MFPGLSSPTYHCPGVVEIRRPGRLNTVVSATITTALLASESCFAGPSLLLAAAQLARTRWLAAQTRTRSLSQLTDWIQNFVTEFYKRVYADEQDWFREAFSRIFSFEHHVATQTS